MEINIFTTSTNKPLPNEVVNESTFFSDKLFSNLKNNLKQGYILRYVFNSKQELSSKEITINDKELRDMIYSLDNYQPILANATKGITNKQKINYLKEDLLNNSNSDKDIFDSFLNKFPEYEKEIVKEFLNKDFTHFYTNEYPKEITILDKENITFKKASHFYEKDKILGYFSTSSIINSKDKTNDLYESIRIYETTEELIENIVNVESNQRYIHDISFKKGIGLSLIENTITQSQIEDIITNIDIKDDVPDYQDEKYYKQAIVNISQNAYSDSHLIENLKGTIEEKKIENLYKELDRQGFTHFKNEDNSIQLINSEINVITSNNHQFDTYDSDIEVYVEYNPFDEGTEPKHRSLYYEPMYLNNELKKHNEQNNNKIGYFLYKNPTQETLEKENVQALFDRHRTETDGFTSKDLEFRNNHYTKHVLNKLNNFLVPDPDTNNDFSNLSFKNKTIKLNIARFTDLEDQEELVEFNLEDIRFKNSYSLSTKNINKNKETIKVFNNKLNSMIKTVELGFDPNLVFKENSLSEKIQKEATKKFSITKKTKKQKSFEFEF